MFFALKAIKIRMYMQFLFLILLNYNSHQKDYIKMKPSFSFVAFNTKLFFRLSVRTKACIRHIYLQNSWELFTVITGRPAAHSSE